MTRNAQGTACERSSVFFLCEAEAPRLHSAATRTCRVGITLFLFHFLALAPAMFGQTVAWPSQRNGPAGAAVCEWPAFEAGQAPAEWHFKSKGSRRYERGLAVWASPAAVIVGNRPMAFVGGCDNTMHALDLTTKKRVWFKITNGPIRDAPAVAEVNGEQVVFWGSSDRFVYAHKAADGERLWTRETMAPSATLGDVEIWSPLAHDSVIYITMFAYDRSMPRNLQTGRMAALAAEDGRKLWDTEVTQGPVNSPAGATIDGRFTAFTVARRGQVSAWLVGASGAERAWTAQLPHEALGSPAVLEAADNPLLFIGSKFGNIIALDARTGREKWKYMTGNWIDNSACVARVNGTNMVFVGSYDYHLYAFRAEDGHLLWRKRVGGEIYSAPCFFFDRGMPIVAVAALDNHVYALNAGDGRVETSFFTGQPIWDKVAKGETLWGSPIAIQAGADAIMVHGSYNGFVFTMPMSGDVSIRAKVQRATTLWRALLIVGGAFLFVVIPLMLLLSGAKQAPQPGSRFGHRFKLEPLYADLPGLKDKCARVIDEQRRSLARQEHRPPGMSWFEDAASGAHVPRGMPLVGVFCDTAPLEIVHALGAWHARLDGGNPALLPVSGEIFSQDVCPVVRTGAALIMTRERRASECRMLAAPGGCDAKRKLAEILSDYKPVFSFALPPEQNPALYMDQAVAEIRRFAEFLEAGLGRRLTAEALRNAMRESREMAALVREIRDLRSAKPGAMSARDFFLAMQAYWSGAEPAEWRARMAEVLDYLKTFVPAPSAGRRRLALTGSPIIWPNFKVLTLLEESGADIVADTLCFGALSLAEPLAGNDRGLDSMFTALAEKYMFESLCPCFPAQGRRIARVLDLVVKNGAEAVVNHNIRLCPAVDMETRRLAEALRGKGIPFLSLRADYGMEDTAQLRMQCEAFIETLAHAGENNLG